MSFESIKDFFTEDISDIIDLLIHGKYSYYFWILILLPLGLVLCFYASKWILININNLITKRFDFLRNYIMPASKPLSFLITAVLFKAFQGLFEFGDDMEHILQYFNVLFTVLSVTWLLIAIVKNFFEITRQKLVKQSKVAAAAMLPIISKITVILIIILAVLFALKNLGFDIGAIIAAFGIGGVGVALASQKNIENLFGGIMLSVDQPIRVGDVGKFNNIVGTVIDVGMRSTKVQTADRTIVAIPNAVLSAETIETYAYRDKILISHKIDIRYGTYSTKIQNTLKKIRDVMVKDVKIDHAESRINATAFSANGITIEIFAYALTTNYNEYLTIQEDFIMKINDIILKDTEGFGGNIKCCCASRECGNL